MLQKLTHPRKQMDVGLRGDSYTLEAGSPVRPGGTAHLKQQTTRAQVTDTCQPWAGQQKQWGGDGCHQGVAQNLLEGTRRERRAGRLLPLVCISAAAAQAVGLLFCTEREKLRRGLPDVSETRKISRSPRSLWNPSQHPLGLRGPEPVLEGQPARDASGAAFTH